MAKKNTNSSKYEWLFFADSYLSLARIGLEELKNEHYIRKTSWEYNFSYENKWLLIAIIYNIKHAIELALKIFSISINREYLKTHNTQDLASDLMAKMPKIKKIEVIEKFVDITFKYYKCEFLDRKILNNINVLDIQNDIFRYPDNSAFSKLDLEVFKILNNKDIDELLDDTKKIKSYLNITCSQINETLYIDH